MPSKIQRSPRTQDTVHHKCFNEWRSPEDEVWARFFRCPKSYLVRFVDLVDFDLTTDASSVDIHPVPGVSQDVVDHLYQNLVVPLAMSHQGKIVLHASAIEVQGSAAVFVAGSGVGKSTLAAHFANRGFRFLTDDSVELEDRKEGYYVRPGLRSIRLWDESADQVHAVDSRFTSIDAPFGKTRFLAASNTVFCDQTTRLQNIYFLEPCRSDRVSIDVVTGSEVTTALLKNCFLLDVESRSSLTSNFEKLSRLAGLPACFRLRFPHDYKLLPQLCDQIVGHMLSTRAG